MGKTMSTQTTRSVRMVAGSTAATLMSCALPLVGAANATVALRSDGTTGIRPSPSYDPNEPAGSDVYRPWSPTASRRQSARSR